MTECYTESYDDYVQRDDYYKNKQYLDNQTCCDENSCDALAYEYDKLLHKCNDVYGKGTVNTTEKGRVNTNNSVCDEVELKRNKLYFLDNSSKPLKDRRTRIVTESLKRLHRKINSIERHKRNSRTSRNRGGKNQKKNKTKNKKRI